MNLTMLLDMAAEGFGDRTVIGPRGSGQTAAELRSMSYTGADLVRRSDADALLYLGVNGPAFPAALFAAARAGVPLVPVNYRLGAEQLEALLGNHPKALAIAGPAEREMLDRVGLTVILQDEWLESTSVGEPALTFDEDEPASAAVIIYTSGTTSAPKGVLLQHRNLLAYVWGSTEFACAEPTDAALVSVPPYHIAAVANVITNLYAGRRTMVLEQFTPQQWIALVRKEEVTNALVVPTMLKRIMDVEGDLAVPSLRTLAYGGAAMPAVVIERALQRWPTVDFVNAYGLTETSSTISVLGPADHRSAISSADPKMRKRLSSAGQVVPSIELEVRDADGAVVPPDQQGRIWVKGDQVSAEYASTGPALDSRGFFDTRDEGYLDADGYLFISGRTDDTIIRGAENIAPAEIEEVLLRHDAVSDAVVVGLPHEEWGQCIHVVVVPRPGAQTDAEELRAYVRASLRGSKTPDGVTFWDDLPRTETGKVVRRTVVERLLAEQALLLRQLNSSDFVTSG